MDTTAVCRNIAFLSNPFAKFLFLELLFISLWVFLAWKILKAQKKRSTKIIGALGFFFSALPIMFLILIGLMLSFERWSPAPSEKYAVLNAAVKNTCYLDPQRNHCPKNLDELIAIEPEHFQKIAKDAQITYVYYPETNQYTLVVRDKSFSIGNYQVALFDPRIKSFPENYTNLFNQYNYLPGSDIAEPKFAGCFGKHFIINPPPFPGPWDDI